MHYALSPICQPSFRHCINHIVVKWYVKRHSIPTIKYIPIHRTPYSVWMKKKSLLNILHSGEMCIPFYNIIQISIQHLNVSTLFVLYSCSVHGSEISRNFTIVGSRMTVHVVSDTLDKIYHSRIMHGLLLILSLMRNTEMGNISH